MRPIFVVGLPRSGTTLIEQVLASHPLVWGAGELHDLYQVFRDLPELIGRPEVTPIEALENLSQTAAAAMARQYMDRVAALAPAGRLFVVDKMPDNIRLLGLIGLILPQARVILCRRDLRDVAVSCRRVAFTANIWTNDWQTIARRFADFQRILAHWRLVRPVDWLEISYEDCVQDLEGHAQSDDRLRGCGLESSLSRLRGNPPSGADRQLGPGPRAGAPARAGPLAVL